MEQGVDGASFRRLHAGERNGTSTASHLDGMQSRRQKRNFCSPQRCRRGWLTLFGRQGEGWASSWRRAWRLAGAASSVLANPSHRLGGTWAGPVPRKIRIALSRHLTHCRTAPPVVVKKGGKAVGSAARRLPCSTQVPYRVPYSSAIRIWNGRARTQQSYKVLFQTLTRSGPLQRFDMHVGSNRGPSAASRKRTTLFPNIGRICLS